MPSNTGRIIKLWAVAVLAVALGYGIRRGLPFHRPLLVGPCVLIPYAAAYLLVTHLMGIASMGAIQRALLRER